MRLSVVATMYRSAPYLREFHARVVEAVRRITPDYEIVLVNDGSPDESLETALELQRADPRIRVVDLSRNFGHHQAMWTGLQHARGELVFLIDCDLEEDPAWLESFQRRLDESGADVVYGVQESRAGGRIDRWAGRLYYRLFNLLSSIPIPENLLTVRLMTRRYVDALLRHTETTFVISGLWASTGFRQVAAPVPKRRKATTTYDVARRVKMFVNSVTAFSEKPLFFVFYLGALIFGASAVITLGLVVARLLTGQIQPGWPSVMASVWLLGGLIILCQGIQGIYLARVYRETKRRPVAIVRQVHEAAEEPGRDHLRIA